MSPMSAEVQDGSGLPRLDPFELLIADDDPDDRFMILRALGRCRATLAVHAVRDGVEVMEQLQALRAAGLPLPRLLLLDLNMPRMDGREVLAALKADAGLRALPVVVLSTSVEAEDLQRAYADGATSFISKPDGFAQLVTTMRTLVEHWLDVVPRPAAGAGR